MFGQLLEKSKAKLKELNEVKYPDFITQIYKDKCILIPSSLIKVSITQQLETVEEIQEIQEIKCTNQGVQIAFKYKKLMIVSNVRASIKLESISINDKPTITFSVSDINVSGDSIITKIIMGVISSFIESLLRDKIANLSTDQISITESNGLYTCDISEVSAIKSANINIPLLNKKAFDLFDIETVSHSDNGISLEVKL